MSLITGRLDALGRFVEQQDLRARAQRASDRQLLLLPARQVAAAPVLHLEQHGKHFVDLSGTMCMRPVAKPILRFSSTVRRGKISLPCGT
jgi:hypothetical protein